MITREELRRAARHLRKHAAIMRGSYARADGSWDEDEFPGMKAEHDDKVELARKLLAETKNASECGCGDCDASGIFLAVHKRGCAQASK